MPLPPQLEHWLQHEDDELLYGCEPERRGTQRDMTPPEALGEPPLPSLSHRRPPTARWGWFLLLPNLACVPWDLYALSTSPSWRHGAMALVHGVLVFWLWRVRWLWKR